MLTFPPHTLTESSAALPVLFRGNGIVALSKPAGVPADEHPWNAGAPTLCGELRKRLAQGSPAALALGLTRPAAVLPTDAACSGIVLLADRENGASDAWRNAAGSEQLRFSFVFLAKPSAGTPREDEFFCRLPVAAHFSEPRALISSSTGKKSETHFSRLEKFGKWELWRAETTFPRLHQIRLHAAESGLPVVGDTLYGRVPPVLNSELRRKGRLNKGEERPLYASACIHAEKIFVPEGISAGTPTEISAPLPDGFAALLKKLRALV